MSDVAQMDRPSIQNDMTNTLDKLANKVKSQKETLWKKQKGSKARPQYAAVENGQGHKQFNRAAISDRKDVVKKETSNANLNSDSRKRTFNPGHSRDHIPRKSQRIENSDGKPEWKKMRQEKKILKVRRKQKEMKVELYELSIEAKRIWEELRQDNCPADRKADLAKKLFGLVKPCILKLVYAHDTVRVIECLIGHGGLSIRAQIFEIIKDEFMNLIKSTYGHFLVLKMLRCGTPMQRLEIMKSFQGKVVKLLKHKIASSIVDLAYNEFAKEADRVNIIQEFYSTELRLFKDPEAKTLHYVLTKDPGKRSAILKNVKENVLHLLSKNPWKLTITPTLVAQYLMNCEAEERTEIVGLLREDLVQILHTKDGRDIAMICLWHGTAKDRKAIIKTFKTHVAKICSNEHGYLAMLALFDCVDDTTLVAKAILQELMANAQEIVETDPGRKVFAYLASPRNPKHFPKQSTSILEKGDSNTISKKDMNVRHGELLDAVKADLVKLVSVNVDTWITDNSKCVLMATLLSNCGDATDVFQNIVKNATSKPTGEFLDHIGTYTLIKSLIKEDKKREEQSIPTFSSVLVNALDPSILAQWAACNRACFVMIFAYEANLDKTSTEMLSLWSKSKKVFGKYDSAGSKVILKKLSEANA